MAEQANYCNLAEAYIQVIARYLSCNGEVIGIGPTVVFASAATLFLYSELGATFRSITGDNVDSNNMEKCLIVTMLIGMLSLMVHLWVCSTRLFQYYMEAIICDSPMFLLEYTTGTLLADKLELIPIGPLTKFLRNQQPQIHITLCWFVALCYADYVRKNYCRRFNMPYLERWQSQLHERASHGVHQAIKSVNSFVGSLHAQLRSLTQTTQSQSQQIPGPAAGQEFQVHRAQLQPLPSHLPPQDQRPPAPQEASSNSSGPRASSTPDEDDTEAAWKLTSGPSRVLVVAHSEAALDARSWVLKPPILPQDRTFPLGSFSSETMFEKLKSLILLLQWAKVGESHVSEIPTLLWGIGAAALAHRLLNSLFRRFLFRRVPLWEVMLQNLLFIWMVIYGLHFWMMLVKITKFLIDYCYDFPESCDEDFRTCHLMHQWLMWALGVAPLAFYVYTRPRPDAPPVLIWITTNPWQRREMGPQGYYLTRPLSSLHSTTNTSLREEAFRLRRAFSDSKIIEKVPPKKKRYSKSV